MKMLMTHFSTDEATTDLFRVYCKQTTFTQLGTQYSLIIFPIVFVVNLLLFLIKSNRNESKQLIRLQI